MLAERASEKLGCKIVVYRVEKATRLRQVDGYVLRFERTNANFWHTTPKMNVQAAKVLLATLIDLENMRFIGGRASGNVELLAG